MAKAPKQKPKNAGAAKPLIVGPRNRPDVAAALERMNERLRSHGVDTNRHDAYELTRLPQGFKDENGDPYVAVPIEEYQDNLARLINDVIEPIEQLVGFRVNIRDGYRPEDYNAAVGGVATSDHIVGKAVDYDSAGQGLDKLKLASAKFYLTHMKLPIEMGFYRYNLHAGLGGDHETYSGGSVPGEDDKWLAKARAALGIA